MSKCLLMSFVVLAIGAAHAIPPIVGAVKAKSKVGVIVGAMLAAAIAVATGNPVYIVVDLVGVAVGVWIGLAQVRAVAAAAQSELPYVDEARADRQARIAERARTLAKKDATGD